MNILDVKTVDELIEYGNTGPHTKLKGLKKKKKFATKELVQLFKHLAGIKENERTDIHYYIPKTGETKTVSLDGITFELIYIAVVGILEDLENRVLH